MAKKLFTEKSVKEIEDKMAKRISKRTVEIARAIHWSLISKPPQGTPVKTGWARSNWMISRNRRFVGLIGSKENVDDTRMMASRKAILNYDIRKARSIFISNNVPYIYKLNYTDGYLFIEKAKQRALNKFGAYKEKVRLL